MVSAIIPTKPRTPKYRTPEQLTVNQIDVLREVAYGRDPCDTLKHEHRFTNLQMMIYRGWVIYNQHDRYELTARGKAAFRTAVHHAG